MVAQAVACGHWGGWGYNVAASWPFLYTKHHATMGTIYIYISTANALTNIRTQHSNEDTQTGTCMRPNTHSHTHARTTLNISHAKDRNRHGAHIPTARTILTPLKPRTQSTRARPRSPIPLPIPILLSPDPTPTPTQTTAPPPTRPIPSNP